MNDLKNNKMAPEEINEMDKFTESAFTLATKIKKILI